jgi:Bacterial membrane protein YfhO
VTTVLLTQQPDADGVRWRRADIICLVALLALIALTIWNRLTVGQWLARNDLMTFFVPWYAFLGERLRAFDIPGWNPYLFSGTPFAGDPESGWMYLPAMLLMPFLSVLTAFKTLVVVHLLIAGLSTYAFTRVLGMRAVASLVASVAFVSGPLVQWTTYCCTIFSQFTPWIPLALLGVELALRAQQWRTRILSWFVTGFALSQMFAGWIGEGWTLALLVVAGYTVYRAVLSPPRSGLDLRNRFMLAATTGIATVVSGLALGAAGILIRLDVNSQSQLAGGNYDAVGQGARLNPPWTVKELFIRIMGSGYANRATTLGGAVIVLALLAPFLVRRRFAVPFFCALTVIPFILALHTTPLHYLFYLIPTFRTFHEHDPWRVYSVATIGPAILSGAVVDALPDLRGRRDLLWIIVFPLEAMAVAAYLVSRDGDFIGWQPFIAAALATGVLVIVVLWPAVGRPRRQRDGLAPLMAGVLVAAIFLQPTATELTGSWLGWPADASWEPNWHPKSTLARGLETDTSGTDPHAAGAYLQRHLKTDGPFRYVGYGGYGYPGAANSTRAYIFRRFEPGIQEILVNGRPVFLHLNEIQGYDPLQLARYVDFFEAINGKKQNYHFEYLYPTGVQSRLLNLLNVRYILVDRNLPDDRDDVVALTKDKQLVFQNKFVNIYENPGALPRAWIVHDVQQLPKDEILPQLQAGAIDPRQTALIETTPPQSQAAVNPAADQAQVLKLEPDAMTVETTSDAPGLLVLSEIYDPGWHAYVDGRRVDVLPTDYVLRGVPVPAGTHTVEVRYEPRSLRIGLAITGIATLALLATLVVTAWPFVRRVVVRRGEKVKPTSPVRRPELADGGRGAERPTGGMAK